MSLKDDWGVFSAPLADPGEKRDAQLPASLRLRVLQDLTPSVSKVLLKTLGSHFLASISTLGVCPQFGLGYLGPHGVLSSVFHALGDVGCQLACGGFYFGTFSLLWFFSLRRAERRYLGYRKGLLAVIGLIFATFSVFWMINPDAVTAVPFWAWLLGSLLTAGPGWLVGLRFQSVRTA